MNKSYTYARLSIYVCNNTNGTPDPSLIVCDGTEPNKTMSSVWFFAGFEVNEPQQWQTRFLCRLYEKYVSVINILAVVY